MSPLPLLNFAKFLRTSFLHNAGAFRAQLMIYDGTLLQTSLGVNYFRKKLHHRCFAGFPGRMLLYNPF